LLFLTITSFSFPTPCANCESPHLLNWSDHLLITADSLGMGGPMSPSGTFVVTLGVIAIACCACRFAAFQGRRGLSFLRLLVQCSGVHLDPTDYQRETFRDRLVIPQALKSARNDHSHPGCAERRRAVEQGILNAWTEGGLYSYQRSDRSCEPQRGSRVFYHLHDDSMNAAYDAIRPSDTIKQTLVDFYRDRDEVERSLASNTNAWVLYTMYPQEAASDKPEYCAWFDTDGYFHYIPASTTNGYKHRIFDWGGDCVVATRWSFSWNFYQRVSYRIERRQLNELEAVVLLAPMCVRTGLWALLATWLCVDDEAYHPRYLNPIVRGASSAWAVIWSVCTDKKSLVSIAEASPPNLVVAINCTPVTLEKSIFERARDGTMMSTVSLNTATVRSWVVDQTADASERSEFRAAAAKIAMFFKDTEMSLHGGARTVTNPPGKDVYTFNIEYGDHPLDGHTTMTECANPIDDRGFDTEKHPINAAVALETRYTAQIRARKTCQPPTKCWQEWAAEYTTKVAKEAGNLVMHDLDEVALRQVGANRIRQNREAMETDAGLDTSTKPFKKAECATEMYKDPRLIVAVSQGVKMIGSTVSHAITAAFKLMLWYAFLSPVTIASRMYQYGQDAHSCLATDFSRFDGTINIFVRIYHDRPLLEKLFPGCERVVTEVLIAVWNNQIIVKDDVTEEFWKIYSTYAQLTGDPFTSCLHTSRNRMIFYCGCRAYGMSPEQAWNARVICGGDDGVCFVTGTVDTIKLAQKIENAAKQFNLNLKLEVIEYGQPVPFLGRFFDAWNSVNSCCDIERTMKKFHKSPRVPATKANKLIEKCYDLWLRDRNTPIIRDVVNHVFSYYDVRPELHNTPESLALIRNFMTLDESGEQWPNEPCEMYANIAAAYVDGGFNYAHLLSQIANNVDPTKFEVCRAADDPPKSKFTAVVAGEVTVDTNTHVPNPTTTTSDNRPRGDADVAGRPDGLPKGDNPGGAKPRKDRRRKRGTPKRDDASHPSGDAKDEKRDASRPTPESRRDAVKKTD